MYERGETRDATDRLWAETKRALYSMGVKAPSQLSRDVEPFDLWQSEDLLLAQTCGLPFRARLNDKVQLVASPVHDMPCQDGHYYSVIVARAAGLPGNPTLAVNDALSQSGWAAALDWATTNKVRIGNKVLSGGHRNSAQMVTEGQADVAALDAVTWAMIRRWDAFAGDLIEIGRTDPTPALPYITGPAGDPDLLARALETAIGALSNGDRNTLCLKGIRRIPKADYLSVPIPPAF